MKCIFFGIVVAATSITVVSFEVLPLTAMPLVTITEGQTFVAIDNIIYGKLEDEHIVGVVSTTVVVFGRARNNMENFQSSKNNKNNKLVHQAFRIKVSNDNMTFAVITGTRPELIKMFPVIRLFELNGIDYKFIHTGQHYDYELFLKFLKDFKIRKPDYSIKLTRPSGSPEQFAEMMTGVSNILQQLKPPLSGTCRWRY